MLTHAYINVIINLYTCSNNCDEKKIELNRENHNISCISKTFKNLD